MLFVVFMYVIFKFNVLMFWLVIWNVFYDDEIIFIWVLLKVKLDVDIVIDKYVRI